MKLVYNILMTLSARTAILALTLISSIILARALGPDGLGLFTLILLLPELARSFGTLGFDSANAVYAGLEPERRGALVWQSAVTAGIVGGVITVAGICFFAFGAPGSQALLRGPLWLYVLALLTVPTGMLNDYWWGIIRGMNRISLLNGVQVGTKIVSLLLVLVFVWALPLKVTGAVWANVLLSMGTVPLMVVLLRYVGVWGKPSFDWSLWLRMGRRLALPLQCNTIMSYLNLRVDQFIIAALLPPEQLGFYVIAVGLGERLWMLTGAVANALLPHLTNSQQRDPALSAAIARHVMVWTGAACLVTFVLADVAVQLLYSSAFIEAVAPLRWLLPGVLSATAGRVVVAEILAREKVQFTVWVSLAATLVNIVGNLVLVPRMGISGSALASSISYALLSFLVTWYYLRETGVPWTSLVPCRSDLMAYAVLWRRSIHTVSVLKGAPRGVQL